MKTSPTLALVAGLLAALTAAAAPASTKALAAFSTPAETVVDDLKMPQMRVEATRPLPREVELWFTTAARERLLERRHLSSFDHAFLNRFTLPFASYGKAARAHAAEDLLRRDQNAATLNSHIGYLLKVDRAEALALIDLRRSTLGR